MIPVLQPHPDESRWFGLVRFRSPYERSPRFALTRRPVRGRPTDGPAILKRRTSGDWRSLGTEPDRWRPVPGLGPNREGRRLT
jgi:hypothetical protein